MIEFIIANGMLVLNLYLVGYITAVILSLVLAGINDEDPSGILKDSLTWFLDVFYLIGIGILILKTKWNKKGKK